MRAGSKAVASGFGRPFVQYATLVEYAVIAQDFTQQSRIAHYDDRAIAQPNLHQIAVRREVSQELQRFSQ
jgi:hypothetical protein